MCVVLALSRVILYPDTTRSLLFAGQYWGEMGFFRIVAGRNVLGIESKVAWATPGRFTVHNVPCTEDGKHCGPATQTYVDPSEDLAAMQRRLVV
jgi:hypothetical protein